MTDLGYYRDLLDGEARIAAFRRAIERVVRPGDRVLDLGCGLGTFAFFAVRAGAGKVWAVDRDPVVHVAKTLAASNDPSGRVVFLHGDASRISLPSAIDVLIFEDFTTTLLDARTHALLARVQADVLAPTGRMVPGSARLSVAPVRSDARRRGFVPPAGGSTAGALDWAPLGAMLAQHPRGVHLAPGELLAAPVRSPWHPLCPLPGSEALGVEGAWDATDTGPVHALALWFDLEVAPGVHFSNEPRTVVEPWGQVLLPLEPPLEVRTGERLTVSVRREALASDCPGWLVWKATCRGETRRGHEFAALALGPDDLRPETHESSG